jgi:hypothetical protein
MQVILIPADLRTDLTRNWRAVYCYQLGAHALNGEGPQPVVTRSCPPTSPRSLLSSDEAGVYRARSRGGPVPRHSLILDKGCHPNEAEVSSIGWINEDF